jgi:hypothetical protein
LQFLDTYTIFHYLQNEFSFDNKKNYEYHPDSNYIERILDKSNRIASSAIFDTASLLTDFNAEFQTSERNLKNVTSKATIREEYVKCGKAYCNVKHGPYYYAYWRNHDGNKKGKKQYKKYIGKIGPRERNNIEFNRIICEFLLFLKN